MSITGSKKIELLRELRILGDIRERLGANNEKDESRDATIESMDARELVATKYGWELGDNSWGYNIIDLYLEISKELDEENKNER